MTNRKGGERKGGRGPGIVLDVRKIRRIITERGIGVTEFAQMSGIPRGTLWVWLSNGRPISKHRAYRVANTLELKLEEILPSDDDDEQALGLTG